MRRPGARVALLVSAIVVLSMAIAGFLYLRRPPAACEIAHLRFDPNWPKSLAGRVSSDQQAVLSANGAPQTFTVYFDPQSGSVIEEWSYFTLGQDLIFVDGAYQGGTEVPAPALVEGAVIPEPALYPWEILQEPRPECVVKLAGPALFQTSAVVLPGWNDSHEVARLWTLAGGGSMITVDGRLAQLSIDPGVAVDLHAYGVSGLFVGTLGDGAEALGAILSPGGKQGAYRLSLSPRGQGTTQDGVELVLDLEGSRLDGAHVLGTDARASVVSLDGAESPAEASGTLAIKRRGAAYEVRVEGRLDGRDYAISGLLGSGFWLSTDRSLAQVLGPSEPTMARQTSSPRPTATPAPGGVLWADTFDVPTTGLPHESENEHQALRYADGEYHVMSKQGNVILARYSRVVDDVDVEVSVRSDGKPKGSYGLSLREVRDATRSYYWVAINPANGTYALYKWNGAWTTLQANTPSPAINRGEAWNRLRVRCQGPEITVYINGTLITTVSDSELASGQIGLSVSGEGMAARFDNLVVRLPPAAP
ncbi:MAG: DUF1080 domain-containing protein [Chloroflexi bacterium]|nr:DUF1080 domain-containing protein [Chloroflexota bacterium]